MFIFETVQGLSSNNVASPAERKKHDIFAKRSISFDS
jgi:hypothetical protein